VHNRYFDQRLTGLPRCGSFCVRDRATAADDQHSGLVNELRRSLPGSFFTAAIPAATFEKRNCPGLNSLRMITLWPFQLNKERASNSA
jgi:hypothetical protein